MIAPVNNYLACLPILFNRQDHMNARISPVENMFKFAELLLDVAANCRSDLNMASGVFEPHSGMYSPRPFALAMIAITCRLDHGAALTGTWDIHLVAVLCHCPARQFYSVFHQDFYHLIVGNWVVRVFFFYQFFDL